MLRIVINGITGQMGQALLQVIPRTEFLLIGGVCLSADSHKASNAQQQIEIVDDINELAPLCDTIIDFSHASALHNNLAVAVKNKKSIVIGTTGLNAEQIAYMEESSKYIPIFYSTNFSFGIHVMKKLVVTALKSLIHDDFDIEISEIHHRNKKDSPSGTAIALGQVIADVLNKPLKDIIRQNHNDQPRKKGEIGFSSIRGGEVFGDHSIMFLGTNEVMEIKHSALNRKIFATGALRAAKWLYKQNPGLYSMENLLSN